MSGFPDHTENCCQAKAELKCSKTSSIRNKLAAAKNRYLCIFSINNKFSIQERIVMPSRCPGMCKLTGLQTVASNSSSNVAPSRPFIIGSSIGNIGQRELHLEVTEQLTVKVEQSSEAAKLIRAESATGQCHTQHFLSIKYTWPRARVRECEGMDSNWSLDKTNTQKTLCGLCANRPCERTAHYGPW